MSSNFSTAPRWDSEGGAIPGRPETPASARGELEIPRWYAIRTRSQFEKKVQVVLRAAGIETFLPLIKAVHRWSDRNQTIETPLFRGYLFLRLCCTPVQRLSVLKIGGVLGLAGPADQPSPIPDEEIDTLRRLLQTETPCTMRPFLQQGQRVRIRGGALEGITGILDSSSEKFLVISIACIQRAISVRVEGYQVEVV